MQVVTKISVLSLVLLLIAGCGGGGKAAGIPDRELRAKWQDCQGFENPSRIKVMACENYERECARRKSDKLVCY